MSPKLNARPDDFELFRSSLENIIDQRHPLVRLIDWPLFEARFGALSRQPVCPGLLRREPFSARLAARSLLDDALAPWRRSTTSAPPSTPPHRRRRFPIRQTASCGSGESKRWPRWRASTASRAACPTAGLPAPRVGKRRACIMAASSARPRPACAACAPDSGVLRATSCARRRATPKRRRHLPKCSA